MSLYGSRSEHALHCLLILGRSPDNRPISSADLANFQGLSLSFTRKLLTDLERGNIVQSHSGRHGGFSLSRAKNEISVQDVVTVIEPGKRVFDCKEIRQRCALFNRGVPAWVKSKPCEINAVFLKAEAAMVGELANTTLESIDDAFSAKAPNNFSERAAQWFVRDN